MLLLVVVQRVFGCDQYGNVSVLARKISSIASALLGIGEAQAISFQYQRQENDWLEFLFLGKKVLLDENWEVLSWDPCFISRISEIRRDEMGDEAPILEHWL